MKPAFNDSSNQVLLQWWVGRKGPSHFLLRYADKGQLDLNLNLNPIILIHQDQSIE